MYLGITVRALCFDCACNTLRSLKLLNGTSIQGVAVAVKDSEIRKFIPCNMQQRVVESH